MPASVPEAAYELALRSLDQQERRVEELRSRSATLIAAASVAASVLATRGGSGPAAAIALGAYAVAVLAALRVLVPTLHRLQLSLQPSRILPDRPGGPDALADLAWWLEQLRRRNVEHVRALERWFAAAVVAVGTETAAWALSVGGSL